MFGVLLNLVSENQSVSLRKLKACLLLVDVGIQSVPLNSFGACLLILGCVPFNSGGVPLNSWVRAS